MGMFEDIIEEAIETNELDRTPEQAVIVLLFTMLVQSEEWDDDDDDYDWE